MEPFASRSGIWNFNSTLEPAAPPTGILTAQPGLIAILTSVVVASTNPGGTTNPIPYRIVDNVLGTLWNDIVILEHSARFEPGVALGPTDIFAINDGVAIGIVVTFTGFFVSLSGQG